MEFDLKTWLDEEIGYEEPVKHRKNYYKKLCRLAQKHGAPVVRIIAEVWAEACERFTEETAKHYFLRSVKLRLIGQKLWEEERRFDHMDINEILASGVFKRRAKLPLFDQLAEPTEHEKHKAKLAEMMERLKSSTKPPT